MTVRPRLHLEPASSLEIFTRQAVSGDDAREMPRPISPYGPRGRFALATGAAGAAARASARTWTLAGTLGALCMTSLCLSGCSTAGHQAALSLRSPEPPGTPQAWTAMDFAWAQVGKRYCWGGTGPACFDCSGLVQRAWGAAGVRLPRTADAIASELPEVPLDRVQPGDILWWPGHVGLYAGGGWEVEALDRRHGVIRRPVARPHRAFRPQG